MPKKTRAQRREESRRYLARRRAKALGITEAELASRSNLQQGRQQPFREPKLDATSARQFVLLLHAGVGGLQALAYMNSEYFHTLKPGPRAVWLSRWSSHPLVLDAIADLNGGAWEELTLDKRLQVSLDKHFAELAHFLYAHDYGNVVGQDLAKADTARTAIMARLKAGDGDPESPFNRLMRDLLDGKIELETRPQLPALPAEAVLTKPSKGN